MKRALGSLSILLLICTCAEGQTNAIRTSFLNGSWISTLVSVETSDDGTAGRPIGTGFLVQTPSNHIALVTARHVVCDKSGGLRANLAYRLNNRKAKSDLITDKHASTYTRGGWVLSPSNDIAARLVVFGNDSELSTIPFGSFLAGGLEAAAPVFVIGFPMGLRSEDHATPIVRQGIVARVDATSFLIDATVFPGNSGGPVVYVPLTPIGGGGINSPVLQGHWLAGMAVSYVPYIDVAISAQTERPRVTFEENSGLCTVVPASLILELLTSSEFVKIDAVR